VLDALTDGQTNAAIAAELGISAETVKWHVSELLVETGLPDRHELARWWAEKRMPSGLPLLFSHVLSSRAGQLGSLALVVVALTAVIAFLVIDRPGPDGREQPAGLDIGPAAAPEALIETSEAPETCDPPEQLDQLVRPEELLAEGLVPVGRLITPLHCPVYAANRSDRAFVWLGGEGVIDLEGLDGWQLDGATETGLSFQQGLPSPDARLLEVVAVGLNSEIADGGIDVDEAQRVAVTRRTHGEGAYLLVAMQDGGFRRVALASTGELFVAEGQPAAGIVVNQETGELIDVSDMIELGRLPADGPAITECGNTGCIVRLTVRDTEVPAPMAGMLVCPVGGSPVPAIREFELDAGSVLLQLKSIDPNSVIRVGPGGAAYPTPARTPDNWDCEERSLAAGEPLPVHEGVAVLEVRARGADGSTLSAVSASDGTLYMGEVSLTHRCGLLEFC
jgi:hypothetical protein